MVDKIKDFSFVKFCRSKYMDIKRQHLLRVIVRYALDFYPISILNRPLLILEHFNEETVKSVADSLSYEYFLYSEKNRRFTIIIFNEKNI